LPIVVIRMVHSKAPQRSVTKTFATLVLSPFFKPGERDLPETLKQSGRLRNQEVVLC
jgi:hypothetical protein